MSLTFRLLRTEDLPAVAEIEAAVHIEPWSRAQVLAMADLLGQQYAGWVAVREGELLAYVLTQIVLDEMEILTVGVSKNQQGQGVAAALLTFALQDAQREHHDLATCFLEVRVSNAAARALYDKLGFIEVGRRAKYYHDPLSGGREDALILRLNLK